VEEGKEVGDWWVAWIGIVVSVFQSLGGGRECTAEKAVPEVSGVSLLLYFGTVGKDGLHGSGP
jgi:hypothetical protein